MIRVINESDWIIFRTRMPLWRERYLEKLLDNYQSILSSPESAEERFMRLLKRIDKDSMCALFNVEMSRSKCLINITRLLDGGIIDENDLEGFTPDLREKASFFIRK